MCCVCWMKTTLQGDLVAARKVQPWKAWAANKWPRVHFPSLPLWHRRNHSPCMPEGGGGGFVTVVPITCCRPAKNTNHCINAPWLLGQEFRRAQGGVGGQWHVSVLWCLSFQLGIQISQAWNHLKASPLSCLVLGWRLGTAAWST